MYDRLIEKGKNFTILFVDDDLSFLGVVKDLLSNFFKEVYVEKNGVDGLESFIKERQDIVITDITMPKMDGLAMSKKIREIEPRKKIVVISAHGDTSKLIQAIENEIDSFLLKPLDSELLLKKLSEIVDELESRAVKIREKELERLLMEQSKMALMGEMISIIAHQLKQPLSVIPLLMANYAQDCEERGFESIDLVYKLEEDIDRQIHYVNATVNHFANFLKPSIQKSDFSIKNNIHDTLKILEAKFARSEIEIDLELSGEEMVAFGFPKELNQVLINLLVNAYDVLFGRDGKKHIIIRAFREDEKIGVIEIEDNGGGVPHEMRGVLFNPYTTTKGESGTGIGLYLSKKIIEESFDGTIELLDGDAGALFRIKLHLVQ